MAGREREREREREAEAEAEAEGEGEAEVEGEAEGEGKSMVFTEAGYRQVIASKRAVTPSRGTCGDL